MEPDSRLSPWRLRGRPVDKSIAPAYIRARFEPEDRIALVIIDRSANSTRQRITTAERAASPEFQAWLRHENAQRRDVYVSMNPLRSDAHGRHKEDVDRVKHVYLDFDEAGAERVRSMMERGDMPIPHAILNTSHGKYQTVWNVEDFAQNQAEWLMRRMSREFGADVAATDSSRVLRLPGFRNWKRDGYMVTVQSREGSALTPGDFPAFPDRDLPPRAVGSRRQAGSGITQSEKDFAFARREIERGADPHRIAAAIAEYRTRVEPGKHPDLDRYARMTVDAALRKGISRSAGISR